MNGAEDTKSSILLDFNRRLIHLEECGSTKAANNEIIIESHEKMLDRLTALYERGVVTVIILAFLSGANSIMNFIEFMKNFVR